MYYNKKISVLRDNLSQFRVYQCIYEGRIWFHFEHHFPSTEFELPFCFLVRQSSTVYLQFFKAEV